MPDNGLTMGLCPPLAGCRWLLIVERKGHYLQNLHLLL